MPVGISHSKVLHPFQDGTTDQRHNNTAMCAVMVCLFPTITEQQVSVPLYQTDPG